MTNARADSTPWLSTLWPNTGRGGRGRYDPPTTADFWACYKALPEDVQRLADANYELLKGDSRHPSLHFKRVGRLWSVRVGIGYRALAVDGDEGPIWFWIGSHAEYDGIIKQ